jgi:DNA-nicking Smr family endonuclease
MTRRLSESELQLWGKVARSVRPLRGKAAPDPLPVSPPADPAPAAGPAHPKRSGKPRKGEAPRTGAAASAVRPPEDASGHRRIKRGDVGLDARIDLHGFTQDQARAALHAFILEARANRWRRLLVITGKGRGGAGVLRARFLDWIGDAEVRSLVAGYAPAHARHGGDGAFYLLLKA